MIKFVGQAVETDEAEIPEWRPVAKAESDCRLRLSLFYHLPRNPLNAVRSLVHDLLKLGHRISRSSPFRG